MLDDYMATFIQKKPQAVSEESTNEEPKNSKKSYEFIKAAVAKYENEKRRDKMKSSKKHFKLHRELAYEAPYANLRRSVVTS